MNQFELDFDEKPDIESYYRDQTPYNTSYEDRSFGSVYTPHGIHCIDAQYCDLIQNIHFKITHVYSVKRAFAQVCEVKSREQYTTEYEILTELPINDRSKWIVDNALKLVYENGHGYNFSYGEHPKYDPATSSIDPKWLRKSIVDNPHLHIKIKENLLYNLDNYIENYNDKFN